MSSVLTSEWTAKMADWHRSGLSIADWCRKNSENYHRFLYWRKRLQASVHQEPGRFVELSLATSPISLECNGIFVHVSAGFDAELLGDILSLLRRG